MNNVYENLTYGLNEQQKTAVLNPVFSCTKIVAGAGTGKTKIISKRFTKLVLEEGNGSQNNILVITFTDKAAAEMKGRILSELAENGIVDDAQELWVSTFHSFCNRILKKHSIEVGLSPAFKLGDEKVLKNVYENILKRIKYGESNYIADLDEITSMLGIETDILSIQSIGRLNKIEDVERILDEIFYLIKKIKSLGLTPKEFYQKSTEASKKFSECVENTPFRFDTKDDYAFAWAEHFKQYTDDYCNFDATVFDSIAKHKVILDKFGKRKASEYGQASGFPENIPQIEEIEILLTKVSAVIYAVYQNELENLDIVDFDDLINKSVEILKNNEELRSYYQDYFKHIIIDEFQDTNGAQLELIELLMNPKKPNITFVGDRKQSIYGFRHAQMENLEVLHQNAEKTYSQRFDPINLSLNYRSTSDVLNAVNYVTEKELGLCDEKLSAGLNHPCSPKDVVVSGLYGFENTYEHKISEAKFIACEILDRKESDCADFKDFAVLVKSHSQADLIEKYLRKSGIPALKKVNTGFFSDPVIKNVTALLRLTKNTIDEVAFVRILKIQFSDAQIYHFKKEIDTEVLKKKGPDNLEKFEELKKMNLCEKFIFAAQLVEDTPDNPIENNEIWTFSKELYKTVYNIRKSSQTLLQTYYTLINGFTPYCDLGEFEKLKAHNDLMIFEKIIGDFMQSQGYISINTFLDYLDSAKEDRSFELPTVTMNDVNAVQILTIHASKGLEFPYVFVTSITSRGKTADKSIFSFDMQYGEKPGFGLILNRYKDYTSSKSLVYKEIWKKPRERNEEIRLFYVAVSRAKKYLNVLNFEPFGHNASIKPAQYIQNLSDYLGFVSEEDSDEPIFS